MEETEQELKARMRKDAATYVLQRLDGQETSPDLAQILMTYPGDDAKIAFAEEMGRLEAHVRTFVRKWGKLD